MPSLLLDMLERGELKGFEAFGQKSDWQQYNHAPTSMRACWSVLGLSAQEQQPTLPQIRIAFRTKAMILHPDHGGEITEFQALLRAYETALDYVQVA
jgi:hypothetical protein